MANNTCKNKNCGCKDSALTTPAPCSCNVITCPPPDACPETFSDCCVLHMGDPIFDLNVNTGDPLCVILQKLAILLNQGSKCMDPTNDCNSVVNLQTTAITTNSVSLYWDALVSLGSTLSYRIQYSTDNASWNTIDTTTNTATIPGLLPNTLYYINILTGCNGEYAGCQSVTITCTTKS